MGIGRSLGLILRRVEGEEEEQEGEEEEQEREEREEEEQDEEEEWGAFNRNQG